MLVVGRRRDESVGVAGSGGINMAVAGAGRPIPVASSIETRGKGIGIAVRGVVDTRVIGKPARVVNRIYSIQAARLHKPCGESRGCCADDESRCECNLGFVQHCCISHSRCRFRPARLGGKWVARRHPLNFRSEKLNLSLVRAIDRTSGASRLDNAHAGRVALPQSYRTQTQLHPTGCAARKRHRRLAQNHRLMAKPSCS
jgi:hypothetical protein